VLNPDGGANEHQLEGLGVAVIVLLQLIFIVLGDLVQLAEGLPPARVVGPVVRGDVVPAWRSLTSSCMKFRSGTVPSDLQYHLENDPG
jgi:hypothetical protein